MFYGKKQCCESIDSNRRMADPVKCGKESTQAVNMFPIEDRNFGIPKIKVFEPTIFRWDSSVQLSLKES